MNFRERLRGKQPLVGTIVALGSPEIAEICRDAGADWLFVDMEHSLLEIVDVCRVVQAVGDACPCLVRVPVCEEAWIKRVLDVGVAGLILPQVNCAEQLTRVLGWIKYPPEGKRSVGIGRAHGYGQRFGQYLQSANRSVAVVAQIEHIDAVRNIDAILATAGLDAVFIGPYDLSASIGLTGDLDHPQVRQLLEQVRQACAHQDMPCGIFARDRQALAQALDQGLTLVAVGIDSAIFAGAVSRLFEKPA